MRCIWADLPLLQVTLSSCNVVASCAEETGQIPPGPEATPVAAPMADCQAAAEQAHPAADVVTGLKAGCPHSCKVASTYCCRPGGCLGSGRTSCQAGAAAHHLQGVQHLLLQARGHWAARRQAGLLPRTAGAGQSSPHQLWRGQLLQGCQPVLYRSGGHAVGRPVSPLQQLAVLGAASQAEIGRMPIQAARQQLP